MIVSFLNNEKSIVYILYDDRLFVVNVMITNE